MKYKFIWKNYKILINFLNLKSLKYKLELMSSNSPKNLNDFIKFLAPSDALPISIILAGILLAIFNDVTAFRLIGIGASIIGLISIFMIITQRMNEYVDTRYKSKAQAPNFNITTKKDTTAKRQTFEDYADSMKAEDKKEVKEPELNQNNNQVQSITDGFRVVSKKNIIKEQVSEEKQEIKNIAKSAESKIVIKVEQAKLVFDDEEDIPEMPVNYHSMQNKSSETPNSQMKTDSTTIKQPNANDKLKNTESEIKNSKTIEDKPVQQEPKKVIDEPIKKHYETRKIEGLSADFLKQDPVDNLSDPKQEFEYCIKRILSAIKSVGSIGTTALFMVNRTGNEFKLDAFSTNLPEDKITNKKKFAIRNDIISQIITNSKPEILSEINPNSELEIIPYYIDKVGIRSFIGVPIFYREEIIGILTADSEYADGFDAATVNYFSHFTRLIAILIHNYVEKYDLTQSQKTLEALHKFKVNKYSTNIDEIGVDVFNTTLDLFSLSYAALILWNEEIGNWSVAYLSQNDINENLEIELNSIVSQSIEINSPIYKKVLNNGEFLFNSQETLPEYKKLVTLPIICSNVTFAVLVLASDNIEDLSDSDLESIEILCDYAGSAYERYHLLSIVNENSYVDRETGLLNNHSYQDRLNEEFERAIEYNRDLALILIKIDNYTAYEDSKYLEKMEYMFFNTIQIINKLKRQFDIIAKFDENSIAIISPEIQLDNAKFWAEKLRNEVATSILEIDGKQFNQTISIGVASNKNTKSISDLTENAKLALAKSMEKHNLVTIFN